MSHMIRIDLIDPSPFKEPYAAAWDRSPEYLSRMRASIKKLGIITPLHVYPTGERYELLAGHCRLSIAKEFGEIEVPCDFRSMLDSEDARESYFLQQNIHGAEKPRELARAALLRHPDWTLEKIVELAGVALGTVHTAKEQLKIEKPELFKVEKVEGADGKKYPRVYKPRVTAKKPRETGPPVVTKKDGSIDKLATMRAQREAEIEAHPAPHAEALKRARRRPIDARISDLISAAQAMREVDDEDLAAVNANDLMAEGLRQAVAQINRIIALNHPTAGGHRANT